MRLLIVVWLLYFQGLHAQYPDAQLPFFPLAWLEECTDYFSPLWTEMIPEIGKCQRRPRKSYTIRGNELTTFDYAVEIRSLVLDTNRIILHFTKPHETPNRTIFHGYLHALPDSFRYHFNRQNTEADHYFYGIAQRPSLIRVTISKRKSSASGRVLSTRYSTQLYQNCEVLTQMKILLDQSEIACPNDYQLCDRIIQYEPEVRPTLPDFPDPWIEDCPDYFAPIWVNIFEYHSNTCSSITNGFRTQNFAQTYPVTFPISNTKIIHHFYFNNRDPSILYHKRSDVYEYQFDYRIHTKSDKARKHLFYVVDSIPSLYVLATEALGSHKLRYHYTYYQNCDLLGYTAGLITGLAGYCPNDPNECHPFEEHERNSKTQEVDSNTSMQHSAAAAFESKRAGLQKQKNTKVIYLKDRTCNTGISDNFLSIMIPKGVLNECKRHGHILSSPRGNFSHQWTYLMEDFIVMGFKGQMDWMTNENLLAAKIIVAL
ncbi:MAG: hypothetical protein AAGG68_27960 [Bacteroidota bacterium]